MFQRIRPRSVSDEIVDQVLALIFTGQLASGSRLPSERALSQAFGVGRQAVREGLSRLRAMGLVKVRKPQGAFVQLATPDAFRQPLLRVLADEIRSVEHFLDVRKWLEGMTAAEAAERATEDDLAYLEQSLARLQSASDRNDAEALDESDVSFHLALVTATHNPVVIHLLDTFRSLMWSSHGIRTAILQAADYKAVCEEHRAVAEAVQARTPERAREAMVRHIEMIRRRVQRLRDRSA